MTQQASLRRRTYRTFVSFSIVVALLFAAAGLSVLLLTEDALLERQLELEAERLAKQLKVSQPLSPSSGYLVHRGDGQLPASLHSLRGASPGHHEFDIGERDLMVFVYALGKERLFIVRDVSAIEPSNLPSGRSALWLICFLAIGIGTLGSALGFVTARRIAQPLHDLAAAIESMPAERLHEALERDEHDEEVAFLVRELQARVQQLRDFAAREEQFTRYASHELRNPVAVIKGAAELLNHVAAGDEVKRPLARIDRAVADMEAIVECFLWLARARQVEEIHEPAELRPIVDRVVARYEHILADKEVAIRVEGEGRIAAPGNVLEIAVGNLVANAFHYTSSGEVTVVMSGEAIRVTDTGPGLGGEVDELARSYVRGDTSGGYGLGLAIVQSICNRFEWELDLGSREEGGTIATLRFPA